MVLMPSGCFGMKAHIGVDAQSGLVHTVNTTAANVSDITQTHALLHGEETTVFDDAGYQGVEKRKENQHTDVTWHIALRPGKRRALPDTEGGRLREWIEQQKASVRARVEHPFHLIKNVFGLKNARYRGLAKNAAQLFALFGLANLLMAKRRLFALRAKVRRERVKKDEIHRLIVKCPLMEGLNQNIVPRFVSLSRKFQVIGS